MFTTAPLKALSRAIHWPTRARHAREIDAFEIIHHQIRHAIALVCIAQYLMSRSYAAAEANFVQPFDDLKLISNVLVYGLLFGYWPSGLIWLGLAMIMAASAYLMWRGSTSQPVTSAA